MALKKYDNLVIPWGALHMKELERAILKQGFIQTASREHLSIDFLLLPFGQLWKQLVGGNGSAPSRTAGWRHLLPDEKTDFLMSVKIQPAELTPAR